MRAKSLVRFDVGLDMQLHTKCRKCVAKFRTAIFEVLAWLKVKAPRSCRYKQSHLDLCPSARRSLAPGQRASCSGRKYAAAT